MRSERVLVDARGTGNGESEAFTAWGRVRVKWELSRSASSVSEPSAAFFLFRDGDRVPIVAYTPGVDSNPTDTFLDSDAYIIRVYATPWTAWRVTVTAGQQPGHGR